MCFNSSPYHFWTLLRRLLSKQRLFSISSDICSSFREYSKVIRWGSPYSQYLCSFCRLWHLLRASGRSSLTQHQTLVRDPPASHVPWHPCCTLSGMLCTRILPTSECLRYCLPPDRPRDPTQDHQVSKGFTKYKNTKSFQPSMLSQPTLPRAFDSVRLG